MWKIEKLNRFTEGLKMDNMFFNKFISYSNKNSISYIKKIDHIYKIITH